MIRLLLIAVTALMLAVDGLSVERPLIGPGSVSWQRRRVAAQRTTTSAKPTDAIAWFDFATQNDSVVNYNWEGGTLPSFVSGTPNYAVFTASPNCILTNAVLSTNWFAGTNSMTFVVRWMATNNTPSGSYILSGKSGKTYIRYVTTGMTVNGGNAGGATITGPTVTTGVWYTTIVQYDQSTGCDTLWLNGTLYGPSSQHAVSASVGTMGIGGASGASVNCCVDYAVFFNRLLTQSERDWFYNSGSTITY